MIAVAKRSMTALAGALFLLCAAVPSWAIPPDVWVVNDQSKDVEVIRMLAPPMSTTVSLGGPGDPAPYGVAFSTLPAFPGTHAFISQGTGIKVFDADMPGMPPVVFDLFSSLSIPVDAMELRGIETSLPDPFVGPPAPVGLLHVTAQVRRDPGGFGEPWFIVLDQRALLGLIPPAQLVVDDGPLLPSSTAGYEAMEVHVMGVAFEVVQPAGPRIVRGQRAWYTYARPGTAPELVAARVVGGEALSDPWTVDQRFVETYPSGTVLPNSVRVGAPHERDLPLLPSRDSAGTPGGHLTDLDTGTTCPVGDIPRALVVTGPGFGSYDIWVLERDLAGGANDWLRRVAWDDCSAEPRIAVGLNPIDIDSRSRVDWQELYIANRASDSVTVVQDGNPPTATTLPLPGGGGGGVCVRCPRSIAVRERPETICRAVNHQMSLINGGADLRHTWDGLGCGNTVGYTIWCRCLESNFNDCSPDCVANCPPQEADVLPWCEIDSVDNDNEYTTSEGGSTGKEERKIAPNDK
ncbi:hypothetical protein ABI59_10310 [Acidobacteria bacterium Mor1]|nr:hypothetical protein ABI59_10310 [Acidobacteria bacterium Mor1]